MLCDGDTCASLQYFEHHPSAGNGGGGGSGGGGTSSSHYTYSYTPYYYDPVWAPYYSPARPDIMRAAAVLHPAFDFGNLYAGGAIGVAQAYGSVAKSATSTAADYFTSGWEAGDFGRLALGRFSVPLMTRNAAMATASSAMDGMLDHPWLGKAASYLDDSAALSVAGKVSVVAGFAIGTWDNYSADRASHSAAAATVDAVAQSAVTTGVSYAAVTTGLETGALVGSFFGPAGTLIGAGVGAAVGVVATYLATGALNKAVNSTFNAVSSVVGDVKSWF